MVSNKDSHIKAFLLAGIQGTRQTHQHLIHHGKPTQLDFFSSSIHILTSYNQQLYIVFYSRHIEIFQTHILRYYMGFLSQVIQSVIRGYNHSAIYRRLQFSVLFHNFHMSQMSSHTKSSNRRQERQLSPYLYLLRFIAHHTISKTFTHLIAESIHKEQSHPLTFFQGRIYDIYTTLISQLLMILDFPGTHLIFLDTTLCKVSIQAFYILCHCLYRSRKRDYFLAISQISTESFISFLTTANIPFHQILDISIALYSPIHAISDLQGITSQFPKRRHLRIFLIPNVFDILFEQLMSLP